MGKTKTNSRTRKNRKDSISYYWNYCHYCVKKFWNNPTLKNKTEIELNFKEYKRIGGKRKKHSLYSTKAKDLLIINDKF